MILRGRVALLTVPMLVVTAACALCPQTPADTLRRDLLGLVSVGVSGVQARVARDDAEWADSAGYSDLETKTPVAPEGYFRIGSLTKTFVAVLVLQLVGEGRLGLDDAVERWLPNMVRGNGNDGRTVTVRQLVQHRSGIHDGLPTYDTADRYLADRYRTRTPREVVDSAMRYPPDFPPGTDWGYSNTNYLLLGMIIERITGRPWYAELGSRILTPLGLRHTIWPGDSPDLPTPHARGYQQFDADGPLVDVTELIDADASGGLVSTSADVGVFLRALMSGRLLGEAQLEEMKRSVPVRADIQRIWPGARYGLGLFGVPLSCGGVYWMHNGGQLGFITENGVSDDGHRSAVVSLSTALAVTEPLERSAAFKAQRGATVLVDHALCGQ
ncbi:serine hydrolase domain-containing protein [Nocardia arthritidis]|uniref:serine hydrolase domain-containing protein n=1 Tax=Nocardia arthritidis TaxID=228602 RepID=UPI00142E044B|nr:serine hydrolase domain-containing protein [Nocardia arthritidis]